MSCARFLVSGKVHGVFYRGSVREQALQLNITGYAQNLESGQVEVFACGSPLAIDALERWLQHGPPAAHVIGVTRDDLNGEPAPPGGFVIR